MKKLLLAFDGFDHSLPALEEAAEVARDDGVQVTVLSVVPPDARGSKSGGHVGLAPHAHEDVARAHAYLRDEAGIDAEMKIAHGDPADEILAEANTGRYDLLVTGTRGRGPIARVLLGSVSHKVAEQTPCTLLVVTEDRLVRIEPRAVARARRQ
jgi:nucleotide-binding universal stress UspA family protein